MPNTFDAAPDAPRYTSTAHLAVDRPQERLEALMEEAQLQRGSLREQDGYTIPFREGGAVRIVVVDGDTDPQARPAGLHLRIQAPTEDRREHVKDVVAEQVSHHMGEATLDWTDEG